MGESGASTGVIHSPYFCPALLGKLALEMVFLVCTTHVLARGPVLVVFSMSVLNPKLIFDRIFFSLEERMRLKVVVCCSALGKLQRGEVRQLCSGKQPLLLALWAEKGGVCNHRCGS